MNVDLSIVKHGFVEPWQVDLPRDFRLNLPNKPPVESPSAGTPTPATNRGGLLTNAPMQYRNNPEQAISCEDREGNGKCGALWRATTPCRLARTGAESSQACRSQADGAFTPLRVGMFRLQPYGVECFCWCIRQTCRIGVVYTKLGVKSLLGDESERTHQHFFRATSSTFRTIGRKPSWFGRQSRVVHQFCWCGSETCTVKPSLENDRTDETARHGESAPSRAERQVNLHQHLSEAVKGRNTCDGATPGATPTNRGHFLPAVQKYPNNTAISGGTPQRRSPWYDSPGSLATETGQWSEALPLNSGETAEKEHTLAGCPSDRVLTKALGEQSPGTAEKINRTLSGNSLLLTAEYPDVCTRPEHWTVTGFRGLL